MHLTNSNPTNGALAICGDTIDFSTDGAMEAPLFLKYPGGNRKVCIQCADWSALEALAALDLDTPETFTCGDPDCGCTTTPTTTFNTVRRVYWSDAAAAQVKPWWKIW